MANNSKHRHQVAVTESYPSSDAAPDYADAFEIVKAKTDNRTAEQWARDGFGMLPQTSQQALMLAHRLLLGFQLGPSSSPDHILGWSVISSKRNILHLAASGPLMDGHMVWRLQSDSLVMTTFVKYKKKRKSALAWAIAGPIHRNGAPTLLSLSAKKST